MIKLNQISKRFVDLLVLDGISMSMAAGQVSVLLGPSGSGKSTLLRTINGLESFDSGELWVGDIHLPAQAGKPRDIALHAIRRRVGMVFQQFNLFPHRSVLENVIEGPIHVLRKPRQAAVELAHDLLQRVGMREKADARPSTLSGGQQQRVAIARALAMAPEVILFDEPTSALDPEMSSEVTRVIVDLARSGQTMIVVTHDMSFAATVADRLFILERGKIVESGSAQEIFERPQHEATRRLIQLAGAEIRLR